MPFPLSSFQQRWMRSLFSFGSMHLLSLVVPLLAFPWLGRVLGPAHFGLLMYLCLFPPLAALLVDWGFPLGGARLAAHHRDDPAALAQLLGSIVTGKLMLALFGSGASLLLLPFLPFASQWPLPFLLAILAGIAKAMSPLWFYQGTGKRLSLLAFTDMASSLLILLLVLAFVRDADQWMLYLLFMALCKLASNSALTVVLWRSYPFKFDFRGALSIIRATSALFAGLFSASAYHYCFQLVLGYFLTAADMGIMVALDKMLRALAGLITPFTQSIFPEICLLRQNNPDRALLLLRFSFLLTFLAAALASLAVWLLAPLAVRLALGPAYESGAAILRIMVLSIPAAACSQVLGNQLLVPFGQDRIQAWIRALITLASIPLAACLGHFYGLTGGAFVPVIVETGLCLAFLGVALKSGYCRLL